MTSVVSSEAAMPFHPSERATAPNGSLKADTPATSYAAFLTEMRKLEIRMSKSDSESELILSRAADRI